MKLTVLPKLTIFCSMMGEEKYLSLFARDIVLCALSFGQQIFLIDKMGRHSLQTRINIYTFFCFRQLLKSVVWS